MQNDDIEQVVVEELTALLEDAEDREAPLEPDAVVGAARLGDDLGLSSLDLAELVTILEVELEADPFRELVPITSVRTVKDLVQAYVRFLAGEGPQVDTAANEAAARAAKRKARQGSV